MNSKGILMSTDMAFALLNHTKTETRRTRGLGEINANPNDWHGELFTNEKGILVANFVNRASGEHKEVKNPFGSKGELLYTKETYQNLEPIDGGLVYKASPNGKDWAEQDEEWKWEPSLFMPRKYARLWLEIKSISIERLHQITQEEAINEGIHKIETDNGYAYKDYLSEHNICFHPVNSFETLWESINGKDSYQQNPWLWVIKFKVVSKNGFESIKERKEVANV